MGHEDSPEAAEDLRFNAQVMARESLQSKLPRWPQGGSGQCVCKRGALRRQRQNCSIGPSGCYIKLEAEA